MTVLSPHLPTNSHSMFSLRAPAKINWFLRVLGRRADGFHEIQTLMQCISLYDELSFAPSETIEVVTQSPISPRKNLVLRAAMLLAERAGIDDGALITLSKRIPIAAGLGGGSSDAATTLMGLNRFWGLGLPAKKLMEIGAELGSDIPFFIGEPCAIAEGRGERITDVGMGRALPLLLLKPEAGVSSAMAYKGVTAYSGPVADVDLVIRALEAADGAAMSELLKNDLEPPAFAISPEIERLKADLMSAGAIFSAMSGSGSTVFGVFDSEGSVQRAAESFSGRPGLWVCPAVTLVS